MKYLELCFFLLMVNDTAIAAACVALVVVE